MAMKSKLPCMQSSLLLHEKTLATILQGTIAKTTILLLPFIQMEQHRFTACDPRHPFQSKLWNHLQVVLLAIRYH